MAIVRMKKASVLAARSQKDDLLRELMRLGCVEIREQSLAEEDAELAASVSKVTSDAPDWRAKRAVLEDGIKLLDRYAPKKSPLLAPKPEMKEDVFMDYSELEEAVATAKEIVLLDEKIKNNSTEEAKQSMLVEALKPWTGFELPLETTGTKMVGLLLGTIPANAEMDSLSNALSEALEETQVFEIGSDEQVHYISVFYLRDGEEAVMQVLREHGFAVPAFGQMKGTAAENIKAYENNVQALKKDSESCSAKIAAYEDRREVLKACYDRLNTEVFKAETSELLLKTESIIALEGWAEAAKESELVALLEKFECAYELTDPVEEEYPDVPVKLKNNKLTDGLNMVTDMYSLPQYGSVDANPLMAPFFILFYGVMMADMGYGLVMMLIGALVTFKKRPKEGFMKYFGELMLIGGLSTFVMGIFTGGFFGDAPKWVVQLINPNSTWAGFPALIDPLNDTVTVLIGALIIGFIHLNTGMVISVVLKIRSGDVKSVLCEECGTWALFIGAILTVLGMGTVPVIIGVVLYAIGKAAGAKGVVGMFMAILSGVYNDATGWFGDILSYARLMALMLAGSVIAQVFNTLGAMPGNIVIFFVICLLGNALNFGLNLLGCYVHDLRLQCLEFFNKFYVAGGKAFTPLKIRSKYYDVIK